MASKICKIVYFDEDSVTDYVQIVAGGTLEKTTELLNSSDLSEEQKADVSAKGGIGGVFKALLGWEASASGEVSAGLALNRNKMVKNIVKNTILTDFLHIIDENENKSASKTTRGAIKKFEGYVISAEKDSLSYMVMVSPYLSMLRSGSSIPAGDFNIAIDKLENDMGTLYIQNPPRRVLESLKAGLDGDIEYYGSQYPELDRDALTKIYKALNSDVYGQDECKKQILSGMYRLTTGTTNKPVVLMLYGPSGVGKTESAKSISKSLGGELLRIQFSMMQTSEAYDYVFGAEHSKSSFARDMMGRESNVILIDEFDKVNPALYNAFYELFDEGKYVDTNYSVELGQAIFLLTCNFSNENEIKKALGPAMFSRIGCCVEYADLTVEQKQKIVNNWYDSIMASLKDDERVYIETTDIHEWFLKNAERYDNIRILKSKMENAIFEKLTDHFIIMTGSMAEGTQDRV